MTKGIFGGDTTMSHYVCRVRYNTKTYKADSAKLREAFGRERYFQFKTGNEKARARAKHAAEVLADEMRAKTGLTTIYVAEGCFL